MTRTIKLHPVRPDFVPKEDYISADVVRLEAERLWPRVWQVACREEELKKAGDYVVYDVVGESIIVLRAASGEIRAFYNVCQHRGRRLLDGCGRMGNKIHCRFHGWQWNLDGTIARVLDREDWDGCEGMTDDDLSLKTVRVDTWGGFVFVNMDPDAEPLAAFLAPMPEHLDCYEFDKMRYRWYRSVRLPCNWKVALEAFNEAYHVSTSHPQLLDNGGDDRANGFAMGLHGMFRYPDVRRPLGAPSSRTGRPMPDDLRPGVVAFFQEFEDTLGAIFTARGNEAVRRLMTEVGAEAGPMEVIVRSFDFQREAAVASGAGWADVSFEQMGRAGADWHVFPNLILLMWPDGGLAYRARPDGNDPGSCIYDMWSLARYAPGAEPVLDRQIYHGPNDWKDDAVRKYGLIIAQDFGNVADVQRGMASRGFRGARTNPLQETVISNFHRALREYLERA